MRLLFDTNVIIDAICGRQPWAQQTLELLALVDSGEIEGILCATTVTTIDYLFKKRLGNARSREYIKHLLEAFTIANVDYRVLSAASRSGFSDFEDAVLHEAACRSGAEAIVTGDRIAFKHSRIPIYSPHELHVIEFPPSLSEPIEALV